MEKEYSFDQIKPGVMSILKSIKGKHEQLVWTGTIIKINQKGQEQARDFGMTNKYIYNLGSRGHFLVNWFTSGLRRKIPIARIEAVTYSTVVNAFVLHLPKEYDYHLLTHRRDELLRYLVLLHRRVSPARRLKLFPVEETDLGRFTKSEHASASCWPTGVAPIELDVAGFDRFLDERRASERKSIENTETLISRGGDKVHEGDFELLKTLGRGYFGKVFLCRKRQSGGLYAMKVISKMDIIRRDFFESVRNERAILETVSNPFVVSLKYCFASSCYVFFVMDFKQGGELYHHLRKHTRFTEPVAKFYSAQILLGLEYLHSRDILYRDMKPENILLDTRGNASLADYGISKILGPGQKTRSFVGTPDYVAPEIILRSGHNMSVDVWCLGVILYEMVFGIPPFSDKHHGVIMRNIVKKELSFPSVVSTSAELVDLITRCLRKQPERRIGAGDIAQVKQHAWFRDVDWGKMSRLEIEAPINPGVSHPLDTSNFYNRRMELELPEVSDQNKSILKKYDHMFQGF